MRKIQRMSKILQFVFTIILIGLPFFAAALWFYFPIPNPLNINTHFFPKLLHLDGHVSFFARCIGFLLSLVPLAIEMFCVYCLLKLFSLFEHGHIFTKKNVDYIRYIGLGLLLDELIKPCYESVISCLLYYYTSKQIEINLSFTSDDINYILFSIIILLISSVMLEACKFQEEQYFTV